MTVIEIVLSIVAVLGLALAYQAKHNGVSIQAQASTDLATAKADITADVHALELKVTALEAKFSSAPAAAAPAAPVQTNPPAAAPTS